MQHHHRSYLEILTWVKRPCLIINLSPDVPTRTDLQSCNPEFHFEDDSLDRQAGLKVYKFHFVSVLHKRERFQMNRWNLNDLLLVVHCADSSNESGDIVITSQTLPMKMRRHNHSEEWFSWWTARQIICLLSVWYLWKFLSTFSTLKGILSLRIGFPMNWSSVVTQQKDSSWIQKVPTVLLFCEANVSLC